MIVRHIDDADGIIFVTGRGLWSLDEIDKHFRALREMIDVLRSHGRPIRVLSDVTSGERQDSIVEDRILDRYRELYELGDRVAVLVSPSDRAHVADLLCKADIAIFSSRIAAEMWLMTLDLAKPS